MMDQLQRNFDKNDKEANIPIFMQIGKYFEESGVK